VDYKKLDDEALMRLIALTQEQALGALYDRYSRLVYSMALNATGDSGLAEEITQDVFLRVWGKAETYKPEQGKVVTWMSSITRYRAIDLIRQRGIRPEGNRLDWAEDDDALNLPDSVNIESEVEVSQQRQRVHKAMAQLPPEQRKALAYAFFQGYSHSQIAEALREPLGTVKTRIRLAMQKLRQILYEDNLIDE
jgi:RNA polymerase sigma-70 factor (ECF subfamily)